jgi:hypothetical protein
MKRRGKVLMLVVEILLFTAMNFWPAQRGLIILAMIAAPLFVFIWRDFNNQMGKVVTEESNTTT